MAAFEASASSAASSSVGMGRALANSAASSSFASGVTRYLHVCEWSGLLDAALAKLRHFEEAKQSGQHLRWVGLARDEIRPHQMRAKGKHGANELDCARHVHRAGDHVVHRRILC